MDELNNNKCSGCKKKTKNYFLPSGECTIKPTLIGLCEECTDMECCMSCGWFTGSGLCSECRQFIY